MREIFKLVGRITIEGIEGVQNQLKDIDRQSAVVARSMSKVGREISSAGMFFTKFATGPIVALAGTMALLSGRTGAYADKLGDLVEITGMSSSTLQEMENVARHAGVSFDVFVGSVAKFSNSLPEIIKGSGNAATALKTLGVNIYDSNGNIKKMDLLFPEMINKLRNVENITKRNALAQDIFGRSLQDLAPVLGLTIQEFEGARKEAHALGLVMSEDALKAADNYRIEIGKLKAQFTAILNTLAGEFIPILRDDLIPLIQNRIIPAINSFIGAVKSLTTWFHNLDPWVKNLIFTFTGFIVISGPLLLFIGKLITELKGIATAIAVVRSALLVLSAAAIANPFTAGVIAVIALSAALYGLSKAFADVQEAHKKYTIMTTEQAAQKTFAEGVAVMIKKLKEYGSVLADDSAITKYFGEDIKNLETQANALGYTLKGTNEQKIKSLSLIADMINNVYGAKQAYEKYNATIKDTTGQEKRIQLTKEEIETQRKLAEERDKINKEYEDKIAKQTLDEIQLLNRKENEELANARKYGSDENQIIQSFANERKKILVDDFNDVMQKAKEAADRKKDYEQQWTRSLIQQTGDRLGILEIEKQEALQKADELGADKKSIVLYYENETAKEQIRINNETAENIAKTMKEKIDKVLQTFQQLGSSVSGIFSELSNNQQIATDNWYNKEKLAIENNLKDKKLAIENSNRSEEEKKRLIEQLDADTAKKQTELDAEADKKRTELRRKQAIQDKNAALFNAAINIGEALTKALTAGPVIGQIFQGIIAVLGAIQMATIAARPIPFARGGLVKGGRGGVQAEIGEGQQDELILPLKTGIATLADALINKLASIIIPTIPLPALAGAGNIGYAATTSYGGQGRAIEHHWHIGTLIADDRGIKELERRQLQYRVSESQRKGNG